MSRDILLEIGLEEMPAHVVGKSVAQLKEKTANFLQQNRLSFDSIEVFSTPRRLAVKVINVPESQEDIKEEVKGPAKKIALNNQGEWSKAAEGFVRGQGVTVEEITFKTIKDVEYVYVTKEIKGQNTIDVLPGLKEVITSLTFPVTMHWNRYTFEYIRPIHWIVALYGAEIIDFTLLDVQTGRTSRGHRFLGQPATIADPSAYEEALDAQAVIVDAAKREAMIRNQIEAIATKHEVIVDLDAELLEEVTNLVEYPTAFLGSFDEKYLSVPEEVLVTSMKEHQRYFDVRNQDRALLPYFISVRNGNEKGIENVAKGNQKVLTARLEDAEFFYQEDQKLTIAQCVEKLKQVAFHEKIGSLYQKMQRVTKVAQIIGQTVGLSDTQANDLKRASEIYKFDLVTNMVGEFPELQGIMGEKYALLQGETLAVAQAIREHYLPISSEGALPESTIGAVLAIADKLDSLLTFFAAGMVPSGSNDPFALRRQTYGIIRIIEQKEWNLSLLDLRNVIKDAVAEDLAVLDIQLEDQTPFLDFLNGRVRQFLATKAIRHDIIEAVIHSSQTDLSQMFEAATVLNAHVKDAGFKPSIEALTRVINLAKKQEITEKTVDEALFENQTEQELYTAIKEVEAQFTTRTLEENYVALMALQEPIEAYFEQTMVMVEDEAIRHNRLAMLTRLATLALTLASLDELMTK
ncbi:glycine--tRNA ligase subunit beta [Enterococcus bulliens]